jgi:uncharacterized protein (TIGR02646 family)
MIKLTPVPAPEELTPAVVKELTEQFKANKKTAVWRQEYIKTALLKMTNSKCCYCECEVNLEGCFVHVEHFHPKGLYENEVVQWDNLLPSCGRCNTNKGTLDTQKSPIIHPVKNDPKQYLEVKQFYFYHKDELGEFTIEKLDLNDENLSIPRFKLARGVIKDLNDLIKEITLYLSTKVNFNEKEIAILSRKLRGVMQLGTKERKYSAVISSTILANSDYQKIKQIFIENYVWNDEFIELENKIQFCALI